MTSPPLPAFEQLLASCVSRVHRAAAGWLGDEHEGREVAQEALLKAFNARDSYDSSRPFYPWLHTIVRNACRDAAARRKTRGHAAGEPDELPSSAPNPLIELDRARAERRLKRALAELSDEHREIIVMRHFEELSYAEIAEVLGVARGTVMSRLFRARKALAALMEES